MRKTTLLIAAILLQFSFLFAQNTDRDLEYYRAPGFDGLNVFETSKDNDVEFDGFKVRVGGDFALQFQALDHSNADGAPELVGVGSNVNLPTANLNIDAQMADGLRLHLRTFLSSRHHNEAWVKGGYIQVDKLDFVSEGFASGIMKYLTLRAGVDQPNYGDAQFRRTDNGMAIYNPFVGNFIMDSYTTEPFFEVNVQASNILLVAGLTNGLLNPSVNYTEDVPPTIYGKVGYDGMFGDDLRFRLTGSFYSAPGSKNGNHLYAGDRAGARYYRVLDYYYVNEDGDTEVSSNFRTGRFNPGFKAETAFQVNPFIKFKGLEFFGIYEMTSGSNGADDMENGSYTQMGAELLYRFGGKQQFYIGGRYNSVSGYASYESGSDQPASVATSRINVGGGYFMTKNTLVKLEYVSQDYDENFTGALESANFSGVVLEAVIGF
jgi:hypothetical protein